MQPVGSLDLSQIDLQFYLTKVLCERLSQVFPCFLDSVIDQVVEISPPAFVDFPKLPPAHRHPLLDLTGAYVQGFMHRVPFFAPVAELEKTISIRSQHRG